MQAVEDLTHTVTDRFGAASMAIGIVRGEQIYAEGFGVKEMEVAPEHATTPHILLPPTMVR